MRYNYNLNGGDRKPLVEAISQILNQPAVYQGAPSFSYTVGDYTVDRNGVLSYNSNIHPDFAAVLISDLRERGVVAECVNDATNIETLEESVSGATADENVNDADEAEAAANDAAGANNSITISEVPLEADTTEENTVVTGDTAITENIASRYGIAGSPDG